jgi:hypothetical protein
MSVPKRSVFVFPPVTKADAALPSDHLKVMLWESVYADLVIIYVPVLSSPGMEHVPDILTGADKYSSSFVTWFKYTPGSNGKTSGSGSGAGDDTHPQIENQQKNAAKNRLGSFPLFTLSSR